MSPGFFSFNISKSMVTALVLLFLSGCFSREAKPPIPFDPEKWGYRNDEEYPYREQMVDEILADSGLRELDQDGIWRTLGFPDRENEGHLYYQVAQTSLGPWPLHTRTLVVKLDGRNRVEWIRIHE